MLGDWRRFIYILYYHRTPPSSPLPPPPPRTGTGHSDWFCSSQTLGCGISVRAGGGGGEGGARRGALARILF
eukprot:gene14555-biopygen2091